MEIDKIIMTPTLGEGQIRFVLSWPSGPKDLDLHSMFKISRFSKCEVYFGKRDCPGAGLDTDNFNYGQNGVETITISTLGKYVYAIVVHKFIDISGGIAQGDSVINSYQDEEIANNTEVKTNSTMQVDYPLIQSNAQLVVYISGLKAPIVTLPVPTIVNNDERNDDMNKYVYWLAMCLDGNQGINSLAVVNDISINKPDSNDCEKLYKKQ